MYNSLSRLPSIPYKILEYLATSSNAENLWKLLAYNDYEALSKPDLTFSQKMNLIWKTGPQEQYSVFFTPLVEDAVCQSKCICKVYQYYIHAKELYNATIVYAFDFLFGGQMSLVDYDGIPVNRGDLFVNIMLSVLNGAEVNGVGKMAFYDDMSRYVGARVTIGNSKTFTGIQLFLATVAGDTGEETPCGT